MKMQFDQDSMMADTILSRFTAMKSLKEQLRYVLVLMYQLDAKGQDLFHEHTVKLERYLGNVKFIRAVGERDGLVEDHPVEYYGRDFGYDDPFIYKEKLEVQINKIELELLAIIGLVIKYLKESSIFVEDSM
jgi:hypothetical protein